MSAAGKVTTGFSHPYVALYAESEGAFSYSSGMQLARGVDVSIEPASASDNKFYADNAEAEKDDKFTGGTVNLTVDGLHAAAKRLIFGLPAAGQDGGVDYDDDMSIPYVGVGYIAEAMSDGVTKYFPTVLYKVKFQLAGSSAATRGDSISWQTQALTADILRADDAKHKWKWEHETGFADEAAAIDALEAKLGA